MNKKILIGSATIVTIIIIIFVFLNNQRKYTSSTEVSATSAQQANLAKYTLEEVSKHNTKTDCWMIIDTSVLDVTKFIASGEHNPEIIRGCGLDATSMFKSERKHSQREAQTLLKEYTIGTTK